MSKDPQLNQKEPSSTYNALSSLKEAGRYLHLGLEFMGAIVLFVGAGYLLDQWLELTPLFTLVGVVVAFVAIVAQVVRFSNIESRRSKRGKREGGAASREEGSDT